ncbi:MAG: RidA family protein [Maricaulis sp.]|jgi:enamine deaminase RidA (YjgF/YER057c/UK114 family)|nr:RidA family protein [Maricaulis sp.]MDG2044443.1 RidA family protein [Maricaulis sp.]
MKTLLPPGWPRPKGYSNGIVAEGQQIFVAGVIGWDTDEVIVSDDFAAQFRKVLENTLSILAEAGAGPEHIVRMTGYVTSRDEYIRSLRDVGAIWKDVMGRNYPVMAFVEVSSLMEKRAKVEIETTAVI